MEVVCAVEEELELVREPALGRGEEGTRAGSSKWPCVPWPFMLGRHKRSCFGYQGWGGSIADVSWVRGATNGRSPRVSYLTKVTSQFDIKEGVSSPQDDAGMCSVSNVTTRTRLYRIP